MCGIVAAVAERPIQSILIEGLKRLEYRGYDSAGLATLIEGNIELTRAKGKVSQLEAILHQSLAAQGLLIHVGPRMASLVFLTHTPTSPHDLLLYRTELLRTMSS